jgi:SAM-dependent methyltransferase
MIWQKDRNPAGIGLSGLIAIMKESSVLSETNPSHPVMSNPRSAGFDQFAANYEAALQQGLNATGESKDYFAQGRIQYLAKQLGQLKHEAARILDFGCGTGTSVPLLLALPGAKFIAGVDVSEESLKVAAEKYGAANVTFGSLAQISPAGDIDVAFCNGVFHHIPLAERAGCMKYIFDSLRPGGLFAFWENNPWNPGTRYVMSRIPFDRDAITLSPPASRRLCGAAGFEVLATRFLFFYPRSLGLLRWTEPAMRRIPLGGQYIVLCRKRGDSRS